MPPLLNCINLAHRTDRLQSFLEQMNSQNIAFKRWNGVETHESPIVNISLAHKQIIYDAKKNDLPCVHVCEDDIVFTCPGAWKYYLAKIPHSYDFFCGLIYYGWHLDNGRILTAKSGILTLYTVHSRFYDDFLATDNSINLDREIGQYSRKRELYTCMPFVVKQLPGYSDHFKRNQEYTVYEEGKQFLTL